MFVALQALATAAPRELAAGRGAYERHRPAPLDSGPPRMQCHKSSVPVILDLEVRRC